MTRYLIIGTGVAGISASEAILEEKPGSIITMVGEEPEVYYTRPGLAYLLTGEIPTEQLSPLTGMNFKGAGSN